MALWIASGFLALVMVGAGASKLAIPRAKLMEKMKWAQTWSDGSVKLLGIAELLGGIGMVVPWATGVMPILTPIAAVSLLVLMLGAVKTHVDLHESIVAPAVLALLCAFVALGRFDIL